MKKDLILSIDVDGGKLSFNKLKTIRGSLIFFDGEGNFYGSWDDLWHVLTHLSNDFNYHWTKLKPTYISKDFKQVITTELNKHKKSVPFENMDVHMQNWDTWEKVLFEEESIIEIDLTSIKTDYLRFLSVDYSSVLDIEHLFEIIGRFINSKKGFHLFNLSNGKKIKSISKEKLSEQHIIPGAMIKVEYS